MLLFPSAFKMCNASFIGSKSPKRWFSRTHTHHLSQGLSALVKAFLFRADLAIGTTPRGSTQIFFSRKNTINVLFEKSPKKSGRFFSDFQTLSLVSMLFITCFRTAEIVIVLMARQTVVYSYACHSSFYECHLSLQQYVSLFSLQPHRI